MRNRRAVIAKVASQSDTSGTEQNGKIIVSDLCSEAA